jgi:hypothetical protein
MVWSSTGFQLVQTEAIGQEKEVEEKDVPLNGVLASKVEQNLWSSKRLD